MVNENPENCPDTASTSSGGLIGDLPNADSDVISLGPDAVAEAVGVEVGDYRVQFQIPLRVVGEYSFTVRAKSEDEARRRAADILHMTSHQEIFNEVVLSSQSTLRRSGPQREGHVIDPFRQISPSSPLEDEIRKSSRVATESAVVVNVRRSENSSFGDSLPDIGTWKTSFTGSAMKSPAVSSGMSIT